MPSPQPLLQRRILRATALLGAVFVGQSALAADVVPAGVVKQKEPMQREANYGREHCMQLPAGSTLEFSFHTSYPVDFNLHHHADGGATTFPLRQRVDQTLAKTQPITEGGNYCFQWINPVDRPADFPINLTYEVK